MRRMRSICKARGLLLGLVVALSLVGGGLFPLNYTNASLAATSWPMFRHDLQHTGRSPYSGPAVPWPKWGYTTGNGVHSSPAMGSDGTIYVGSDDHNLYAISDNGTAGNLKWSYTTGDTVYSSPAIGSDGNIYFGSYLPDTKLYALSDNGTAGNLKWSYTTGGPIDSSPRVGSDGTIYFGSGDNNLYAIGPANGCLLWSYTTGGDVQSSPTIGGDGTIYVGSADRNLYAIGQQLPPTLTSINPASGNLGQTLNNVIITGANFTGANAVSFGAGITVNGFTVNNDNQITASITIAGSAALGARDVSVTTPPVGSGTPLTGTLTNGFMVNQPSQSVNTATGTGIARFTTSSGSIINLTAAATTPCGTLSGFTFPHGFFSFNITSIAPGSTVTIIIVLPSNMPANTQYWKCINGQWVQIPVVSVVGNIVTIHLTDGGTGDADGVANGTIIDPGGPAVPVPVPAVPTERHVSPTMPNNINPAQISLQYLNINPQQTSASQPVTIITNVVNTGDEAGSLNVALKINGKVEQTKLVSIGPQATQPVKFTITRSEPGTYTIDVGGQRGSFTINDTGSHATSRGTSGTTIAIIFGALVLVSVLVVLLARR